MARRLLPLVVACLLVGVVATPARAIGSFGPPVTVDDPPCAFDGFNADLARDASGVAHGFADLWGSNCNTGVRIDYRASLVPVTRLGAVLAAWRYETNRLPPQRLRSA
jgi:hypothetical protein